MKKMLLFLFCFLSFSLFSTDVFAAGKGELIYSIEKVVSTTDNITISGWAYVNLVHTIGGENYNIYFVAINKNNGKKTSLKEVEDYYGGHGLYHFTCYRSGSKCDEVYPGFFIYNTSGDRIGSLGTGYSLITPLASCKDKEGSSCVHYNPWFDVKFDYSSLKTQLNYKEGDQIYFQIVVKYTDHGSVLKESVDPGDGCRWDYEQNEYLECHNGEEIKESRNVAFDRAAIISNGSIFSGIIKSNISVSFVNFTNYGRLHVNAGGGAISNNYFTYEDDSSTKDYVENEFNIIDSKIVGPVDYDELGLKDVSLRWYKLKTGDTFNSDGNTYYKSGNISQYYAPSAWGNVQGTSYITFFNEKEPPDDICYYQGQSTKQSKGNPICANNSYRAFCTKQIILDDADVLKTYKINDESCRDSTKHEIGIIKPVIIYDFYEETTINKGDLFIEDKCDKVWPGIKWCQQVEWLINRKVQWQLFESSRDKPVSESWEDLSNVVRQTIPANVKEGEVYFHIKRTYKDSAGLPVTEYGYVSDTFLYSLDDIEISDYVDRVKNNLGGTGNPFEDKAEKFAKERFLKEGTYADNYARSLEKELKRLRLGFSDSSKYDPDYYQGDEGRKIIEVVDSNYNIYSDTNLFSATEKLRIKNAWLKGTEVIYDVNSHSDYIDGGNYYYFPFDIPAGESIYFGIGLDYKSLLREAESSDKSYLDKEKLTVWCKLTVDEGNLETKNYRVIDLSNPFPNVTPTRDLLDPSKSRAVNWIDFWNSSSGFNKGGNLNYLYDRIDNAHTDYSDDIYTVDLTPDSIDKIREYNKEQLEIRPGKTDSKTYINATLDENGNSEFIMDFDDIIGYNPFSKFPISRVGEKGNDLP